jgi:hypothetical protein
MNSEWQQEFCRGLENLVDQAVVSGARQGDVFEVAIKEIECLRVANERDPDPADDMSEQIVEEPSNDWPAAE